MARNCAAPLALQLLLKPDLKPSGPGIAALGVVLFAAVHPLSAQVSPGPLSKAHQSLDSPLKCASCHVFGAGSPKLKCLGCHNEIRGLVREHEGFHGRVVNPAKGDVDCARCHTEHYGKNFRIFKWETSKEEFDHRQTGYSLLGRHSGLRCEQCHNAKYISQADRRQIKVHDLSQTFEGLHPACLSCHEDRHAGQLGADCEKCHSVSAWKPAKSFDHSTSHYALTGKHQPVECAKCHRPLANNAKVAQYTGLSFQACTGCHQDPHHGAFAARCESCHTTADAWKNVKSSSGFDHGATRYPAHWKASRRGLFEVSSRRKFQDASGAREMPGLSQGPAQRPIPPPRRRRRMRPLPHRGGLATVDIHGGQSSGHRLSAQGKAPRAGLRQVPYASRPRYQLSPEVPGLSGLPSRPPRGTIRQRSAG